MIVMHEPLVGTHISTACKEAAELSQRTCKKVKFTFNHTDVIASPGEKPEELEARWNRDYEAATKAYRNSQEYKDDMRRLREAKRNFVARQG